MATSTDLNSWTQLDTPVLTAPQIPWVKKNPITYGGSQQLRDPYVMEYPIGSGHWIMYFVAVDLLGPRRTWRSEQPHPPTCSLEPGFSAVSSTNGLIFHGLRPMSLSR